MITLHTYDMDVILRNETLLATARSLTLYSTSGMNIALNRFQTMTAVPAANVSIKAKGIFAYKGELAVGWCLLTQEGDGMDFCPEEGYSCVQIYVAENCRRQGIGTAMLNEAIRISSGQIIKCYQWGEPQFFDPFIKQNNFQSVA
jgi:ribosomal protein S18 acetylase RimI-like enzyme